ncbi:MAG: nucleotidyltransferase family protein [Vulcanimicrobiaceae bacterium]
MRQCLQERPDSKRLLDVLARATDGEIHIVGGSIRRALLGGSGSGDLDLIVPNGDPRAFDALRILDIPFEFNRHGHHRYHWNGLQIDVFQPEEFFTGFPDVEGALRYFDLRINALALHVRSQRILDPFRVLCRRDIVGPGINWQRWEDMPLFDVAVLAIRLARIMHEVPRLSISTADAYRLRSWLLPKLRDVGWSALYDRFPAGREAFFGWFDAHVLQRTRPLPSPVSAIFPMEQVLI